MPTSVIRDYLARRTHDGLREIIQIFRHDFVQYMGMILSWSTLIDGEAQADAHADQLFREAAARLQAETQRVFTLTSSRLHPVFDESLPEAQLGAFWDTFYSGFIATTTPELAQLETETLSLVAYPAFALVIERQLGMSADGDTIAELLLRPFDRLRVMFQPEAFDTRVAEVVTSRHDNHPTPAD